VAHRWNFLIFAGAYYLRCRTWAASALGLSALIAAGAFSIYVRPPADIGDINILQFTEGREVILTAPAANLTTIPARAAKLTI